MTPLPDSGRIRLPEGELENRIQEAVRRAQCHVLGRQAPDGSWGGHNSLGPFHTAMMLITERFLGTLSAEDAREGIRWLRSRQRPDGSFAGYGTDEGSFRATLGVYAGLHAAGVPDADPALVRARSVIARGGGFEAAPLEERLFLVLAGLLDGRTLPRFPLAHKLWSGTERWLSGRYVSQFLLDALNIRPGLIRGLRARAAGTTLKGLARREADRVVEYLTDRQNPAGDWFGQPYHTALAACCLYVLGIPSTDDRVQRALRFLDRHKRRTPEGLDFAAMHSAPWDTAFTLRALVESGVPRTHPAIRAGVKYLLDRESRRRLPLDWQNPSPGAPRRGGWSFVQENDLSPDVDTTAMVLLALRDCANPEDIECSEALSRGLAWELGMQNPDGGWGAFTWGHRSKAPGPVLPVLHTGEAPSILTLLISPPIEVTDPSTEEVTARVIHALSRFEMQRGSPEIDRALAFLERQRAPNGAWWGRWIANFTSATGFVLAGIASVVPRRAAPGWVQQAVDWLVSQQHTDGGWGESLETYLRPETAGAGPSQPSATGIVLQGLIAIGVEDRIVDDATRYLLENQEPGGGWHDEVAMGVVFPGWLYYRNDLWPSYFALGALAAVGARRGIRLSLEQMADGG